MGSVDDYGSQETHANADDHDQEAGIATLEQARAMLDAEHYGLDKVGHKGFGLGALIVLSGVLDADDLC